MTYLVFLSPGAEQTTQIRVYQLTVGVAGLAIDDGFGTNRQTPIGHNLGLFAHNSRTDGLSEECKISIFAYNS